MVSLKEKKMLLGLILYFKQRPLVDVWSWYDLSRVAGFRVPEGGRELAKPFLPEMPASWSAT